MLRLRWQWRLRMIALSAAATGLPASAPAHVKWFCAYDIAQAPHPLADFLDRDFAVLTGIAIAALAAAGVMERLIIGRAMVWSIDRVTQGLREQTETLMRATYGGFFVALCPAGGIILTPELVTRIGAISWWQLGIAACFAWRRTLPLAALGMAALYVLALRQSGLFHLLDYPIFLGAAAYFALVGTGVTVLRLGRWAPTPLDVVRYAASVTLMWASVEKWGYPQWTFPLFVSHPAMAMGFGVAFYMKAAGIVEFSLAFALLGTPLMRRTAAIILASMFVTAVLEFGKIDAIGHSPIVAVMLAIMADNRAGRPQSPLLAPVFYVVALALVVTAYYGTHMALFPARAAG